MEVASCTLRIVSSTQIAYARVVTMTDDEGLDVYREVEDDSSPAWLFNAGTVERAVSIAMPVTTAGPDPNAWLIEAMSLGRVDALGKLHAASKATVKKFALRITGDAALADEVTAATFLQAWIQANRFDPMRGSANNWLLCIARSRAIDAIRAGDIALVHPDPLSLLQHEADQRADPQFLALESERATHLHRALLRLSPLHRQLLTLAYFKGSTHEEIAHQLLLPLGTVKSHIKRALTTLRRELVPYWGREAPRTCLALPRRLHRRRSAGPGEGD